MNNLNLTNELNKLWEGRILNLEFDILHHKIKFKIKVYRPGTRDEQFDIYNVVFSRVSSFYFCKIQMKIDLGHMIQIREIQRN